MVTPKIGWSNHPHARLGRISGEHSQFQALLSPKNPLKIVDQSELYIAQVGRTTYVLETYNSQAYTGYDLRH